MDIAARRQTDKLKVYSIVGAWALVFLACVFAYWPGLSGPFVFDDFGSIDALGDRGGVKDWSTFKAFVFGGHAGPTGRPLALLSFLIDAQDWPADPWPFKRTNLIIHLLNGALLGCLINMVLNLLEAGRRNTRWIALLCAAGWMLHPFLVSTTLYAVQRMAQLSALFTFAGLIAYLYYRSQLVTRVTKAYVGMSLSIGVFTFLAMISKENGILLPVLIGVIELTVVASQQQRLAALNRYWAAAFIILPSSVIALYLGEKFLSDRFYDILPPRDFSTYERLLTQPRVLVDYLRHWFVPELYTTGVFQDHFIKSTGVLSPVTTLFSALLHLALISLAVVKRQKWPLFALATLFFYVSHALESSVINLEMYFEHRNYLAAAFLFVPLVVSLQKKVGRRLFAASLLTTLMVLTGFTRYSATIWKDYPGMVEAAARKAPTSARAQGQYSTTLYNAGRYDESLQVIDRAVQTLPDRTSLRITRSTVRCRLGVLSASDFDRDASILSNNIYDPRMIRLYTTLTSLISDRTCPDVSMESLRTLFVNMLRIAENGNPESLRYSQIQYFVGFVDVRSGHPERAVVAFKASLRARSGSGHAMAMAALLATNEYLNEALYFSGLALAQLESSPSDKLRGDVVGESDVLAFRANIRAELAAAESGDLTSPVPE